MNSDMTAMDTETYERVAEHLIPYIVNLDMLKTIEENIARADKGEDVLFIAGTSSASRVMRAGDMYKLGLVRQRARATEVAERGGMPEHIVHSDIGWVRFDWGPAELRDDLGLAVGLANKWLKEHSRNPRGGSAVARVTQDLEQVYQYLEQNKDKTLADAIQAYSWSDAQVRAAVSFLGELAHPSIRHKTFADTELSTALKNLRGIKGVPLLNPQGDAVAAGMIGQYDSRMVVDSVLSDIQREIAERYNFNSITAFKEARGSISVSRASDTSMELLITLDANGKKQEFSLPNKSSIGFVSPYDLQVITQELNKTLAGNTKH
jgi:hypothetical protein